MISNCLLIFLFIFVYCDLTCLVLSEENTIKVPEHFHDHDSENGEHLLVETLFKPSNCDESNARKSKVGDNLGVKYTGSIHTSSKSGKSGMVFDKSGKNPLIFRLGSGEMIRGWEEG
jgi:FKBP-type peptidyl-prolyl cis-trans isomerase